MPAAGCVRALRDARRRWRRPARACDTPRGGPGAGGWRRCCSAKCALSPCFTFTTRIPCLYACLFVCLLRPSLHTALRAGGRAGAVAVDIANADTQYSGDVRLVLLVAARPATAGSPPDGMATLASVCDAVARGGVDVVLAPRAAMGALYVAGLAGLRGWPTLSYTSPASSVLCGAAAPAPYFAVGASVEGAAARTRLVAFSKSPQRNVFTRHVALQRQ